jgi:hypothetical protein
MTTIGDGAFRNCDGITNFTIPSTVTSIGENAFNHCDNIGTIIIPASVATIGAHAFSSCPKATIYCRASSQPSGWNTYWNGRESLNNLTPAYFYSEHTLGVGNGTYWHYVNGVPTVWSHSYTSSVTSPTCTERGYTTYTCSVCGRIVKDTYTSALGHIYSKVKVDATCTEQGYDSHTCSRCGDHYKDNYVAAPGHDWVTSTCDAPKTCKTCGATEGTALGHNEVFDPAVLATCTTTGKTAGSHCSRCNKVFTPQQIIPATGHTWVDATCTTSKTCSVCGTTEGASLGHKWNAATYSWSSDNSTCTATRTCANDSAHTQTARANVTSKVTTEPTCDTTGVETYYANFEATWCTSQQKTKTIPATDDHTWGLTTITRQPTCTTTGTKTSNCTVCGEPLFEAIPATGNHTLGNWEITLEPTTTSTGTRVKKCTQCQEVQQTETIPKLAEYTLAVNISTTSYQQAGSGAYTTGKVAFVNGTVASKIKSNETLTYKLIPAATKTGKMYLSISAQTNATFTLVADDTSRNSYTLTITGATGNASVTISGRVP